MLFKLKIRAKDEISKYIGCIFKFTHDRHETEYHIVGVDLSNGKFLLKGGLFFKMDTFLAGIDDGSIKVK